MNDQQGERELVLGNRQLLTIFFVATLLCGVFFAMGYVVGGNSAKSAAAASTDGVSAPVAEGKREEPPPSPVTDVPPVPAPGDAASTVPSTEPKVADNPAAAAPQPLATATESPVPQPAHTMPAAKANTEALPGADTSVFVSVPEKDTSYWQVAAEARPAADVLVKALRDRQLPAILAESSKPEYFRVLVGPYRSTLTLADAKKKLTELSFDGLIVQKY